MVRFDASSSGRRRVIPPRFGGPDYLKERVGHGFLGGQTLLHEWSVTLKTADGKTLTYRMVIAQELVQKVNRLLADESLVFSVDKAMPGLAREAGEDLIVLGIQLDLVLVQVLEQLLGTQDLGNLDQLVGVAVTVEEGLFAENHRREHGSQRPHVQRVVVLLEIHQQLRTLEVARCDSHIVLGALVVELSQSPVDQAKLMRISPCHNPTIPGKPTLRLS